MFMGAINAFSGVAGKGRNVLSGEVEQAFADIARDYRARGVRWVVVGDANYGEGSSREHAALSPRLLGGVAVIARSFARIHETNLKKQGLLALTFQDPAAYERIREDDRIGLVGLAGWRQASRWNVGSRMPMGLWRRSRCRIPFRWLSCDGSVLGAR